MSDSKVFNVEWYLLANSTDGLCICVMPIGGVDSKDEAETLIRKEFIPEFGWNFTEVIVTHAQSVEVTKDWPTLKMREWVKTRCEINPQRNLLNRPAL